MWKEETGWEATAVTQARALVTRGRFRREAFVCKWHGGFASTHHGRANSKARGSTVTSGGPREGQVKHVQTALTTPAPAEDTVALGAVGSSIHPAGFSLPLRVNPSFLQ